MSNLPCYGMMAQRPILMTGVHGGHGEPATITTDQVREVYRNSRDRPLPIFTGHQPVTDSTPSLGEERLDELVEDYTDANGVTHDLAILGRVTKLNSLGHRALGDSEYLYYSPQLKRDATAGWVMEGEALTNIPRQQGLHSFQLADSGERFSPGSIGRVSLSDPQEDTVPLTKDQMSEMLADAIKPLADKITDIDQRVVKLSEGDTAPPADDDTAKRLSEMEIQLADAKALVGASQLRANYAGKLDESVLAMLVPLHQALALSDRTVKLADGKEQPMTALVTNLADALVKQLADAKPMSLTTLTLSDGKSDSPDTYTAGRDAVRNH